MQHFIPPVPFALEIAGLVKRFDRPAVDGVEFESVADRRILRAARPERRRQDNDLAHDRRPAAA